MVDFDDILKQCLENNMKSLERNELDLLYREVYFRTPNVKYTAKLTIFLEYDCGINTIDGFKDTTPDGYCFKLEPPKGIRNGSELVLPEHIKHIGQGSFLRATGINMMNLSGIESIGSLAFSHTGIKTITFSDPIPVIHEDAFKSTDVAYIYLPDNANFNVNKANILKLNWTITPRFEKY